MLRTLIVLLGVTVCFLGRTGSARAADRTVTAGTMPAYPPGPQQEFAEAYILGRLEVGIRFTYFVLTDPGKRIFSDSSGNGVFLGGFTEGISIDGLAEKQSALPSLYARYRINDYFAVEAGWETLGAETMTYFGHTDGDVELSGLSLLGVGFLTNDTRVTPFAGAGLAYLMGSFDHAPWGQGVHIIESDDAIALLLNAGASIDVGNRLEVDLAFRYVKADVNSRFYLRHGSATSNHASWSFPFDNWAVQLGLKYMF